MNVKVVKKINPTTQIQIEFTEERDLKEAMLKASPFINMHTTCGKCHGDNLSLRARNTKGGEFIYIEQVCLDCRAQRSMGEYKSPKGALFFKQWQDPYVPSQDAHQQEDINPEEAI